MCKYYYCVVSVGQRRIQELRAMRAKPPCTNLVLVTKKVTIDLVFDIDKTVFFYTEIS